MRAEDPPYRTAGGFHGVKTEHSASWGTFRTCQLLLWPHRGLWESRGGHTLDIGKPFGVTTPDANDHPLSEQDPSFSLSAERSFKVSGTIFRGTQETWPVAPRHTAVFIIVLHLWVTLSVDESNHWLPPPQANDLLPSNQKAPLIWFLFTQLSTMTRMSFHSSFPLLQVISLVQFACINRRPRWGDVTWPWQFCFSYIPRLVSWDLSVEPDLEESYIKQLDSKPKQPLKH